MKGSVVFTTTRFECAAENCGGEALVDRVNSVLAALDRSYAVERIGLPDDWTEIGGRTFCPKHDVEVTAMVRTPTLVRHGKGFVGGYSEELVDLKRSHIGDAIDRIYEGALRMAHDTCATAAGMAGDAQSELQAKCNAQSELQAKRRA